MLGLKDFLRRSRLLRPLRLARLSRIARHSGHEDWQEKLAPDAGQWQQALAHSAGRRVLIATSMGGHFAINAIDRLLAVSLTARGAKVSVGLCDGMLTACQMCESNLFPDVSGFLRDGPQADLCAYCFKPSVKAYRDIGIETHQYSAFLTNADRQEAKSIATLTACQDIKELFWRGLPVGEHAYAGTLRFFASGDLAGEPSAEPVLRRYLEAAILTAVALEALVAKECPEVILAHHGIYVPQGMIAAVARKHKIRLVTWNQAYRSQCFMFSHHDTYHHTMMDEPVSVWSDYDLSDDEREMTRSYLKSRWSGSQDWISFQPKADMALTQDIARLGLDPSRPVVLALTNVMWDAQIHYPSNAFTSQREWLVETVRWFADRPHLQLVIRVHPAELTGTPRSRQFAADILNDSYGPLPSNIVLIGPEKPVSTYDLARACNSAIIFATKTGVELTSMGIPTIVAGEAWIRGKGLTLDAASRTDYFSYLEQLPFASRLSEEATTQALRFAHHFFFRRMIPVEFVKQNKGPRRFTSEIRTLRDLQQGYDAGLDVICAGILDGTPFHMPEDAAARFARSAAKHSVAQRPVAS